MNQAAFDVAKNERATAAAQLAGFVEALLSGDAIPEYHRARGRQIVRDYNEAHARMELAIKAAA